MKASGRVRECRKRHSIYYTYLHENAFDLERLILHQRDQEVAYFEKLYNRMIEEREEEESGG